MASAYVELVASGGWTVLAAAAVEDVLVENRGQFPVLIAFSATLPGADDPAHVLNPNTGMPRLVAGNIYGKALKEIPATVLIVSTS